MTVVVDKLKRAHAWLMQRPPGYEPPRRIVTIAMWIGIVLTPAVTATGFWLDGRADLRASETQRCEQRIESRHGSRARALTNIEYVASVIRVIDEFVGIPDELYTELAHLEEQERALVDEQLPVLTLENCLTTGPINEEKS